ncbi:hypothetical protein RSAG8_01818, partial [Rhizoctonia solani AG-8 WAC10335]
MKKWPFCPYNFPLLPPSSVDHINVLYTNTFLPLRSSDAEFLGAESTIIWEIATRLICTPVNLPPETFKLSDIDHKYIYSGVNSQETAPSTTLTSLVVPVLARPTWPRSKGKSALTR